MRRLGLLLFPVRERKKVFTAEKAMKLFKWFSLAGMAWGCGCGVETVNPHPARRFQK